MTSRNLNEVILKSAQKCNHGKFHDKYRGSLFRGVSVNGKAWQTMLMIDQEKIYLCSLTDPYKAAQLYDIAVIQAKGFASKLNFNYTKN